MRKPIRTISGVAPVAVMVPPRKCDHGACLYCPTLNAPQSYTPESPAVLRAIRLGYDPKVQVEERVKNLELMGHSTDKVELIIMGGTFLSFPEEFQFDFVKKCYDGLNGEDSKDLAEAKRKNEHAQHRCVALCIETRPDVCSEKEVENILKFGCTRVELGVQAIDDEIYRKVHRSHTVKDVVDATKRLKKAGFKIGYHLMPGLPGSNLKKDLEMFKEIFSDENFKPDQIKIYPCQVIKGAGLESMYKRGEYKPYDKEEVKELIIKMLEATPEYCRAMRIMREIPLSFLVAGVVNTDLRKEIEDEIIERKLKIKEIRLREIGFAVARGMEIDPEVEIEEVKYKASEGEEIFIQAVNKDRILFGLLRLRLERDKSEGAMVRELHVYGPAVSLGKKDAEKFQHKGLGREMMKRAEEITKKSGRKKIRVISGVGVREYYRDLGYELDDEGYMAKELEGSK